MEQKMICMFTGHRNIDEKYIVRIPEILDEVIEGLIARGYTDFRTGGAIGFDTVAALKVLEKKRKYPAIKLHLFLPCKEQTRGWSEHHKRVYDYVMQNCDSHVYTSESYYKGCMQLRNRRMVEGSSACVAFCTVSTGGSAYTVMQAVKNGLEVINVYDML